MKTIFRFLFALALTTSFVARAQFFQDNFTGTVGTALTSHTPNIGSGWVHQTGSASDTYTLNGSGGVITTGTSFPFATYYGNQAPASADYTVQATITTTATTNTGSLAPMFRASSSAQTGYIFLPNNPGGGLSGVILYKQVAGSYTNIGSAAFSFAASTSYVFAIGGAGATITCSINGTSIISVTDSSITAAGFPALTGNASPTASTVISAFSATNTTVLTSGAASPGLNTNTQINGSCGAAAGGTPPYTYQWQRSTTSGGTFSNLTGQTSLTLADTTASLGVIYYYQLVTTDSASATITSNQIVGHLWLAPVVIGIVGDSISILNPGNGTPAALEGIQLSNNPQRQVTINNQAVSGTTTSDWQPGGSFLPGAESAFSSAGVTIVQVMLGTNDSKTSNNVSASTYQTNLGNICSDLVSHGYKVIINQSPYVIPGSGPSLWTAASDTLLYSYQAANAALVNGSTILLGDAVYYAYSAEHPSETNDGIHPNTVGAQTLANLWVMGFLRATGFYGSGATAVAY